MKIQSSLLTVLVLILIAWIGVGTFKLYAVFGIGIPYLAFIIFGIGIVARILRWGRSPLLSGIPPVHGQAWSGQDKPGNPKTENQRAKGDSGTVKWFWLVAGAFYLSLVIILLRHLRLFLNPVPLLIQGLEGLDRLFLIGLPHNIIYITDVVIAVALIYILLHRFLVPNVKKPSMGSDFLPLFLFLGIGLTGIIMRYILRVDIMSVKELTMGLVTFKPFIPTNVGSILYIHYFLVSSFLAYIALE